MDMHHYHSISIFLFYFWFIDYRFFSFINPVNVHINLNRKKENSIGTRDYKQGDLESDEYRPTKALSLADSESPVILPNKYNHIIICTHASVFKNNHQVLSKR